MDDDKEEDEEETVLQRYCDRSLTRSLPSPKALNHSLSLELYDPAPLVEHQQRAGARCLQHVLQETNTGSPLLGQRKALSCYGGLTGL